MNPLVGNMYHVPVIPEPNSSCAAFVQQPARAVSRWPRAGRGRTVENILAAQPDWPDGIVVVQKGKTSSLAIAVPAADMNLNLSAQLPAVEKALDAACRLMRYATLLQETP